MISEGFSEGTSLLHRLDPRVKILSALVFSALVAVTESFSVACAGLLLSGLWAGLAQLPALQFFRRLAAVNVFILFLWLVVPFTWGGEPLFTFGPLAASAEGIRHTALISVKSNALVIALTALLGTTPISRLGAAMHALGLPEKLVHLLLFTYRYIFVIASEYSKLRDAAKARGFAPGTNMHTYRTYAYLFAMLFVRSYNRSRRVHNAMRCRGFTGTFRQLSPMQLKTPDACFGALSLAVTALIASLPSL